MQAINVTFTQPPPLTDVIAKYDRELGSAVEKRIASSFWKSLEIPRSFISSPTSKEYWVVVNRKRRLVTEAASSNLPHYIFGLGISANPVSFSA